MLKLTRLAAIGLIALAVVLALAALALSRRAPAAASAPTVTDSAAPRSIPVVEAATALRAGQPIRAADLRMGTAATAPVGAYSNVADATGAVPVRDLPAGSVLDRGLMAQGYALKLNPGERALAVPVDELVAAGNRILPGDYVDVFLNLRAPGGINTDGQAQARLLLSRLRVLSYGAADTAPTTAATATTDNAAADSRAADIQGGASGTASSSNNGSAPARSAVLAVPVDEANRLLLGAQQGKLFLALRNPTDVGLPDQDLFAPSVAVLSPRRELSPEQRLALASPENDAFAGIDADALAGRRGAHSASTPPVARAAAPVRRSAPRLNPGVEIIRGEPSSHSGSR
ncbi:Flp pilus assembly protein CpaB [Stenotrophomonas sp.]|uniref:Flp pilus assembly protein CpaB n=1 Tax=Stenotrophomonas sp. TaxID=69392 RepID=UPI0028A03892|nr:Flp pilus assembly protein CpaB [Stenotrophomonas sp.]